MMELNSVKWFRKRDEYDMSDASKRILQKAITQKEKCRLKDNAHKWSPPKSSFVKINGALVYEPNTTTTTITGSTTLTPTTTIAKMSNRKKKKQRPENAEEVFEAIKEAEARNNGKSTIPEPIPITKVEPNDQVD